MARNLIVIGASAGGVEAAQKLAAALPAKLPASVLLVIHVGANGPCLMADILNRAGPLPASYPTDGQGFEHGQIYIARPDHHLLVEENRLRVSRAPKEHGHRPSIDLLFQSAASHHGARVVGVLLTGYLNDGAAGLQVIERAGGIAVVQDPADAAVPEMPINALKRISADYRLCLQDIAPLLERLTLPLVP